MFQRSPDPGRRITKKRDLLALVERPGNISNVDFNRNPPSYDQFTDQFKIKIETIALETHVLDCVAAEHLKHCERISKSLPEREVQQPAEKHVAQVHESSDS